MSLRVHCSWHLEPPESPSILRESALVAKTEHFLSSSVAMTFDLLPDWNSAKSEICARIANRFAPFKILLKTKDDPEKLQSWIERHSNIVGIDNLIILDNMSSDQRVLDIYQEYIDKVVIFRFSGFHNNVHNTLYFGDLYSSLSESCDYFIFLDTDEQLTLYDGGDRFNSGCEIISYLYRNSSICIFPCTWLQNLIGHGDRFMLWRPEGPLPNGLKWGKPVISTKCNPSGIINHNTQIDHKLYGDALKTDLFILHRDRLSVADRIQSNLRKLISYGAITSEDRIDDILGREIETFPIGNAQHYLSEIKRLSSNAPGTTPARDWWFGIDSEGKTAWNTIWQRTEMQEFLRDPLKFSNGLFSS